jgi:hypothetical protein
MLLVHPRYMLDHCKGAISVSAILNRRTHQWATFVPALKSHFTGPAISVLGITIKVISRDYRHGETSGAVITRVDLETVDNATPVAWKVGKKGVSILILLPMLYSIPFPNATRWSKGSYGPYGSLLNWSIYTYDIAHYFTIVLCSIHQNNRCLPLHIYIYHVIPL